MFIVLVIVVALMIVSSIISFRNQSIAEKNNKAEDIKDIYSD